MPVPLNLNRIDTRLQPTRKALVIGVRYSGKEELRSTYADVDHICGLLTDVFKYKPSDITVMKDDGSDPDTMPTRDNIRKAIQNLVRDAKEGDHFVFHFSGHGSQKPELIPNSEKDGMDEAIWPADVRIDTTEDGVTDVSNVILDNDIHAWLIDPLPPRARLVIIFDSCHSGTAADLEHCHSDHYSGPASTFSDVVVRRARVPLLVADPRSPFSAVTPGGLQFPTLGSPAMVVSWSACRDPQTAYSNSQEGGMFIESFVHAVRTLLGVPPEKAKKVTHEQLLHLVTESMNYQTTWVRKVVHTRMETRNGRSIDYDPIRKRIAAPRPQLGSSHTFEETVKMPILEMFGLSL